MESQCGRCLFPTLLGTEKQRSTQVRGKPGIWNASHRRARPASRTRTLTGSSQTLLYPQRSEHSCGACTPDCDFSRCMSCSREGFSEDVCLHTRAPSAVRLGGTLGDERRIKRCLRPAEICATRSPEQNRNTLFSLSTSDYNYTVQQHIALTAPCSEVRPVAPYQILGGRRPLGGNPSAKRPAFLAQKISERLPYRKRKKAIYAKSVEKRTISQIRKLCWMKTTVKKRDKKDLVDLRAQLPPGGREEVALRYTKQISSRKAHTGGNILLKENSCMVTARQCRQCSDNAYRKCHFICGNDTSSIRENEGCTWSGYVPLSDSATSPGRRGYTFEDSSLYYKSAPFCNKCTFNSAKHEPCFAPGACVNSCSRFSQEQRTRYQSTTAVCDGQLLFCCTGAHVCWWPLFTAAAEWRDAGSGLQLKVRRKPFHTTKKPVEEQHHHFQRDHDLKVTHCSPYKVQDEVTPVKGRVPRALPAVFEAGFPHQIHKGKQRPQSNRRLPPRQPSRDLPNQLQKRGESHPRLRRPEDARGQQQHKRDGLSLQPQKQLQLHQDHSTRRRSGLGALDAGASGCNPLLQQCLLFSGRCGSILETSHVTSKQQTAPGHSTKTHHHKESNCRVAYLYVEGLPRVISTVGVGVNEFFTRGIASCTFCSASSCFAPEKSSTPPFLGGDTASSYHSKTERKTLLLRFVGRRRGSFADYREGRHRTDSTAGVTREKHAGHQSTRSASATRSATPTVGPAPPGRRALAAGAAGSASAQAAPKISGLATTVGRQRVEESSCSKYFRLCTGELDSHTQRQVEHLHPAAQGKASSSLTTGTGEGSGRGVTAIIRGRERAIQTITGVSVELKKAAIRGAVVRSFAAADARAEVARRSRKARTAAGLSGDETAPAVGCAATTPAQSVKTTVTAAAAVGSVQRSAGVAGLCCNTESAAGGATILEEPLVFCDERPHTAVAVAATHSGEICAPPASRGIAIAAAAPATQKAAAAAAGGTLYASCTAVGAGDAGRGGKEVEQLLLETSCCCRSASCIEQKAFRVSSHQHVSAEGDQSSASVAVETRQQSVSIIKLPENGNNGDCSVPCQEGFHVDQEQYDESNVNESANTNRQSNAIKPRSSAGELLINVESSSSCCCSVCNYPPSSGEAPCVRSSSTITKTPNSRCSQEVEERAEGSSSWWFGSDTKISSGISRKKSSGYDSCAGDSCSSSAVKQPKSSGCCFAINPGSISLPAPAGEAAGGGKAATVGQQLQLKFLSHFQSSNLSGSCGNCCTADKEGRVTESPHGKYPGYCSHQAEEAEPERDGSDKWGCVSEKREIETDEQQRKRSDCSTFSTSSSYTADEDLIFPHYGEALMLILAGSPYEKEKSAFRFSPHTRRTAFHDSSSSAGALIDAVARPRDFARTDAAAAPPIRPAIARTATSNNSPSKSPAAGDGTVTVAAKCSVSAAGDSASAAGDFRAGGADSRGIREEEEEEFALLTDIMEVLGLLPQQQQQETSFPAVAGAAEGGAAAVSAAVEASNRSQQRGESAAVAAAVAEQLSERQNSTSRKEVASATAMKGEAAADEEAAADGAAGEEEDGRRAAASNAPAEEVVASGGRPAAAGAVAYAEVKGETEEKEEAAEDGGNKLTVKKTTAQLDVVEGQLLGVKQSPLSSVSVIHRPDDTAAGVGITAAGAPAATAAAADRWTCPSELPTAASGLAAAAGVSSKISFTDAIPPRAAVPAGGCPVAGNSGRCAAAAAAATTTATGGMQQKDADSCFSSTASFSREGAIFDEGKKHNGEEEYGGYYALQQHLQEQQQHLEGVQLWQQQEASLHLQQQHTLRQQKQHHGEWVRQGQMQEEGKEERQEQEEKGEIEQRLQSQQQEEEEQRRLEEEVSTAVVNFPNNYDGPMLLQHILYASTNASSKSSNTGKQLQSIQNSSSRYRSSRTCSSSS